MNPRSKADEAAKPLTRVLVAEDMPEMRRLMELELVAEGYVVDVVSDGIDLWRHCMDEALAETDLVVTDVRMPGLDGIEVLRRIRAQGINTPVLVVTAFGDHQLHREARNLGAEVLNKPFDFDTLLDRVEQMISERRLD